MHVDGNSFRGVDTRGQRRPSIMHDCQKELHRRKIRFIVRMILHLAVDCVNRVSLGVSVFLCHIKEAFGTAGSLVCRYTLRAREQ